MFTPYLEGLELFIGGQALMTVYDNTDEAVFRPGFGNTQGFGLGCDWDRVFFTVFELHVLDYVFTRLHVDGLLYRSLIHLVRMSRASMRRLRVGMIHPELKSVFP
jgi:hypothetical protein